MTNKIHVRIVSQTSTSSTEADAEWSRQPSDKCHQLPAAHASRVSTSHTFIYVLQLTHQQQLPHRHVVKCSAVLSWRSLIWNKLESSSVALTEKYYNKSWFIRHVQDQTVTGHWNFPAIRPLYLMCILSYLANLRTDLAIYLFQVTNLMHTYFIL